MLSNATSFPCLLSLLACSFKIASTNQVIGDIDETLFQYGYFTLRVDYRQRYFFLPYILHVFDSSQNFHLHFISLQCNVLVNTFVHFTSYLVNGK